jgi:choline dehydrogenase-like flavoprotein
MDLTGFVPADPEADIWDVVVIGTGAGGGTAGFNLAQRGRSVLFVERGQPSTPGSTNTPGQPVETISGTVRTEYQNDHNLSQELSLGVGSGLGGSTTVFAMIMERFRPVDFQVRRDLPKPHDTSIAASWPIQYEDLEPYYREAESLFRVTGTDDPLTHMHATLRAPVSPSGEDHLVHDTLSHCGLHPYAVHYAREYVPGCTGCPGSPCQRGCRNDSARTCVLPALRNHNARYLPGCTVVRLEERRRAVYGAMCRYKGRHILIRGRIFVLALNALLTPALLLRSANYSFPQGLGNQSGLLGRNLMLHVSDVLAVQFRARFDLNNSLFCVGTSLNDFYIVDNMKLGNIHAHAMQPVGGETRPSDGNHRHVVFNTIVEDFPYLDNLVEPKAGSETEVLWQYQYRNELRLRSTALRAEFARAVASKCDVVAQDPVGRPNAAHMCGTCRFGDNPSSSILDRNNKIHGLENVYVLDGSFFPSSGGINPSLTIVANSLRVSALIAGL